MLFDLPKAFNFDDDERTMMDTMCPGAKTAAQNDTIWLALSKHYRLAGAAAAGSNMLLLM